MCYRRSPSACARRLILIISLALLALLFHHCCHAAIRCDESVGGGTCPDGNTCCPFFDADGRPVPNASSCLTPNKRIGRGSGVCCGRSLQVGAWDEATMTGCPSGYRCATDYAGGQVREFCQLVDLDDLDGHDVSHHNGEGVAAIYDVGLHEKRSFYRGRRGPTIVGKGSESDYLHSLPGVRAGSGGGICSNETDKFAALPRTFLRYALCTLSEDALDIVHGFPVGNGTDEWELAYYSNMGSVTSTTAAAERGGEEDDDDARRRRRRRVRLVLISVHGSLRNADDYLCAAHSASRLQTHYPPDSVLVVAPRFLVPEDGPLPDFRPSRSRSSSSPSSNGTSPLRWDGAHPIAATWRYGANSIRGGVSSYDAVDALVEHFAFDPEDLYPNLEAVVLAGHSAGAQLAQRYALVSPSTVLDGAAWREDDGAGQGRSRRVVKFRSVVANPRSYCYLDDRRPEGGEYRRPSDEKIASCPRWNQWQWGLDAGGDVVSPYRDLAIDAVGGLDALKTRYLNRNVTYLSGSEDTIPYHPTRFRPRCEIFFQGTCRLERAHLYFNYLQTLHNSTNHVFKEADGSNHDHTFMFQSAAGLEAIFGEG